ncbi:MAG: hypothetical protein K9N22_03190 [Candidatus Marinimicrobia bacterium]|nr:hypothetical protein [Candidatus Neomarinimicrobiota bacterium]
MGTRTISVLAMIVVIAGCATPLPVTSTLNDFVMMNTKANSGITIAYSFKSEVKDSTIIPYTEGKTAPVMGHSGYTHTSTAAIGRMINDYISNKFMNLDPGADTKLSVTLKDFWLEEYSTSSGGKMLAVALVGGEIDMICIAKVKIHVALEKGGEIIERMITGSSEDTYVSGVGTGTSSSNIYKGKNSVQHVHAGNINNAGNKAVMMLNAFLEENGL